MVRSLADRAFQLRREGVDGISVARRVVEAGRFCSPLREEFTLPAGIRAETIFWFPGDRIAVRAEGTVAALEHFLFSCDNVIFPRFFSDFYLKHRAQEANFV